MSSTHSHSQTIGLSDSANKQSREDAHSGKRRALGKGLDSLLSGRNSSSAARSPLVEPVATHSTASDPQIGANSSAEPATAGKPLEIEVDRIDPNPFQTRMNLDEEKLAELMRSIQANGVVQPIIVRPLPNGRFQLIAGERRWRASEKAGKATVPAIVRQASDEQAMEMTIVENLQRADLNPIEQARAYERLGREFSMTQEQMAQRTGKDRATVSNFLRLLRLPAEVQKKVEVGDLSFGHARTLLALDSAEEILKAANKVSALSMSVRQTETFVQGLLNPEKVERNGEENTKKQLDPNVREAQEKLQRQLGLKVRIQDNKGKGKVVIEYAGLEDFDAILTALGAST